MPGGSLAGKMERVPRGRRSHAPSAGRQVRELRTPPIYVEILIQAPIEAVWELTQVPAQHQRWDLRFTDIDYLPRPDPAEPQRFRYQTRIGFGFAIRGAGESTGTFSR